MCGMMQACLKLDFILPKMAFHQMIGVMKRDGEMDQSLLPTLSIHYSIFPIASSLYSIPNNYTKESTPLLSGKNIVLVLV